MSAYTFKNPIVTRPEDVETGDAFAIKVVAVAGYGWDWAAYYGPTGLSDEDIADVGDKLTCEQAEPLFYVLRESGRCYRD
uniref:Uncharacterized protein n=1 Tax=viral metagenome TaxID=1070528 RepID=A0A6H1ZW80_9ZZZZ